MEKDKTMKLVMLLVIVFIMAMGCSGDKANMMTIDYFGQESPGKTAVLFAPGIISTDSMEHSAPVFSPDGSLVLWTVVPKGFAKPAYFLEMTYENGKWSQPRRPSFNDPSADDYYPSFSVDGKTREGVSKKPCSVGIPMATFVVVSVSSLRIKMLLVS